MVVTPPEQQWRKLATQALIVCAEGKATECLAEFDVLTALPRVPIDGLADARATAAMLIAKDDPATATAARGPRTHGCSPHERSTLREQIERHGKHRGAISFAAESLRPGWVNACAL
jgi:hypothetical protein